ncbi:MLP-like protein 28 [Tripterygium wilfordii]|uniref:MLP-like protein 28 n=1 Tax=Tripterygium wilfordii TaxID=458696 RepID=UPI0018F7F432|nr:MLP-like protein 28 [Tripterygium wilfordii]
MSLYGKIEASVELKTPANKVHQLGKSGSLINLTEATNGKLKGVDIVEGELGKNGYVIAPKGVCPCGGDVNSKVKIEKIDDENRTICGKVIEGDLLKRYKSLKYIVQVTPDGKGSVMLWTIEYEKMNKDVPEPNQLLDYGAAITKALDLHLSSNK